MKRQPAVAFGVVSWSLTALLLLMVSCTADAGPVESEVRAAIADARPVEAEVETAVEDALSDRVDSLAAEVDVLRLQVQNLEPVMSGPVFMGGGCPGGVCGVRR